jgi:DNA primase
MTTLAELVAQDFGVKNSTSRWLKANRHDSLVVDKEKGVFYWNSQGLSGNIVSYLVHVRGWPLDKAKEFAKDEIYYLQPAKKEINLYTPPVSVLVESFKNGLNRRDYFYKRNLTDQTINRYFLGFINGWYSVPLFEDGTLKNFHLRRDNPKSFSLYMKNSLNPLFNVDILSYVNEVFITEGPIDAMNLLQVGLPAISPAGGSVQINHFHRFVRIKEIYILFDNDRGGFEMATRTAKILGEERCHIYLFQDFPKKGYDPVDFFREGHSKVELMYLVSKNSRKSYQLIYEERYEN